MAAESPPSAGRRTGLCLGFSVRSSVPLQLLRTGSVGTPLAVEVRDGGPVDARLEPLLTWRLPGGEGGDVRLYREEEGGYALWIDEGGWFRVRPDTGTVEMPSTGDALRREERLWGLPALLCLTAAGDVPLHAAAIDLGGRAVVLGAPGRHGKTTLATAFLAAGYRVLAEDVTACRLGDGAVVLPGAAGLRIRRETYERLPISGGDVRLEEAERVHVVLDDERRGSGAPVPLAAILFIRESPDDLCRLTPVRPAEALRELWPLSFNLPTDDDRARCFGAINDLVAAVPVFDLHRPFRFDALPDAVRTVTTAFGP